MNEMEIYDDVDGDIYITFHCEKSPLLKCPIVMISSVIDGLRGEYEAKTSYPPSALAICP